MYTLLAVEERLPKFQVLSSSSVYVYTLISEGTPCKISVSIFISLIASHLEHLFRLLPNELGDCSYLDSHLGRILSRHMLTVLTCMK